MKLIDFKTFEPLERLRQIMGAEYITFSSRFNFQGIDIESLKLLETKGIDIDIEDLSYGKDKTIQYKGRRVILYIRDWTLYSSANFDSLPKFHISYCNTLQKKGKRRYVVASRNDGLFLVHKIEKNRIVAKEEIKLDVCKNCLENLGWMGYHSKLSELEKQEIVDRFTLENFFKYYPKDLIDSTGLYRDEIAHDNLYPPNWGSLSIKIRKESNYTCQQCGIRLEKYKKFLDVHHIDGNKSNSSRTNLQVLCVECHSKIHSHMQNLPRLKDFLAIKNIL